MVDVELELSVKIIYQGQKKQLIVDSKLQTDVMKILRSDLLRLKIPYPKVEHVRVIYMGCVLFSWRTVKDGTLHHQLKKVRTLDGEVKSELDIFSMTLQERKIHRSAINGAPSSKKLRSRPRPSVYECLSDIHHRSPSHGTSESNVNSIRMMGEAQKLLDSVIADDWGDALPLPSTQPESSFAPWFSPSSLESSSVLGELCSLPPWRGFTPAWSPVGTTSSGHNTPAPVTPLRSSAPEEDARHAAGTSGASPSQPPRVANPPAALSAARPATLPPFLPNKPIVPATLPFLPNKPIGPFLHDKSLSSPRASAPNRRGPPLAPQPPHTVRPKTETPSSDDSPAITKLNRELLDTRRQIAALVAQEIGILKQLGALSAPGGAQAQSAALGDSFAAKDYIELIEAELQDERRKRADAEQLLKDVERECRTPFVVPALLDAFAAISRLSEEALTRT